MAQNELYKHFAGAMYNVCRRMMGNDEDARDMLQESFVDAFFKLKNLQEPKTFPAWLKRIVVNNCINEIRKRKNIFLGIGEETDVEDIIESENDYVKTEAGKILQALEKISEGCKVVANLYLFEGYDHKEIAQILSISESASKAQYSKAKAKIRNLLKTEVR